MAVNAFFAFLHFFAVFGMVATLGLQWLTMGPQPTCAEAQRMQLADRWYGVFAVTALVVGLLRVFHFEKGKAFYLANPFFHTKLTLFVVAGLLSIYPTLRYRRWRAQTQQGLAPVVPEPEARRIMLLLRLQVVLLVALALCASLMAKGVGL